MNGLIPGVRVWLSGSVPDDADAQLRDRILQFVELLAKAVFREGGTLIHGSHPSMRDHVTVCRRTLQGSYRG